MTILLMEYSDFGLFCTGYVSEARKDHLHSGGPLTYILGVQKLCYLKLIELFLIELIVFDNQKHDLKDFFVSSRPGTFSISISEVVCISNCSVHCKYKDFQYMPLGELTGNS